MIQDDGSVQRVLILSDASDVPARLAVDNARAAFRYARIKHDCYDISGDTPWPELGRYSAIFTVTENLCRFAPDQVTGLGAFAAAGGGIAAIYRAQPSGLDRLFGVMSDHGAYGVAPADSGGLRFPGQALPAFEGLHLSPDDMIGHAGLDQVPAQGAGVLATTITGKPVAWTMPAGRGRTAYWNSVILSEKRARGLIIQTLEAIQPVTVVACANAGVVQIDDFPAPLAGRLPDVVQAGLPGLSPETFYSDVWYPDMLRLAAQFGIAYSCFCAFDYTEPHEREAAGLDVDSYSPPPETFLPLQRHRPAEMGLHGYNHQSLHLRDWADLGEMKSALRRAREFWARFDCGPPPTAYVPPNNQYDKAGLHALCDIFPEISTVSGSHFGHSDDGGNREFGPEPWKPELFSLPRVTSGHECSAQILFDGASQLANFGVWTHFLHPDDVLDVPAPDSSPIGRRNPARRPWRGHGGRPGLYEQAGRLFATLSGRFPWLTYLTTTDAARRVETYLQGDWSVTFRGGNVRIAGPEGGYLRLRLNHRPWRRIERCDGCTCIHEAAARDHTAYVLEMQAPEAQLRLSEITWTRAAAGRLRASLGRGRKAS